MQWASASDDSCQGVILHLRLIAELLDIGSDSTRCILLLSRFVRLTSPLHAASSCFQIGREAASLSYWLWLTPRPPEKSDAAAHTPLWQAICTRDRGYCTWRALGSSHWRPRKPGSRQD